jgi:hypothetical protein
MNKTAEITTDQNYLMSNHFGCNSPQLFGDKVQAERASGSVNERKNRLVVTSEVLGNVGKFLGKVCFFKVRLIKVIFPHVGSSVAVFLPVANRQNNFRKLCWAVTRSKAPG